MCYRCAHMLLLTRCLPLRKVPPTLARQSSLGFPALSLPSALLPVPSAPGHLGPGWPATLATSPPGLNGCHYLGVASLNCSH